MNRVNNLLEKANKSLSDNKLIDTDTKKITDNVYDGYLAGFGPAVITAGLLPTIATYVANPKREKVMDAIAEVANIKNGIRKGKDLLDECLNSSNAAHLDNWKVKIVDASVALKLMVRTYNLQ